MRKLGDAAGLRRRRTTWSGGAPRQTAATLVLSDLRGIELQGATSVTTTGAVAAIAAALG